MTSELYAPKPWLKLFFFIASDEVCGAAEAFKADFVFSVNH